MKPIPRKLLVDTVVYTPVSSSDSWGKTTEGTSVSVEFVKVELVKQNIFADLGEGQGDKAVLFYDMTNSTPDIEFSKGDKITYNDEDFEIRIIEVLKATKTRVHHLEIMLV